MDKPVEQPAPKPEIDIASMPDAREVTAVRHWNPRLFSFRVTRARSFRFRSGEFVMIGLPGDDGRLILRAYSIASPSWDEELEFYSIKVPNGPLTSRLQHIRPGDHVIVRPKPTGTLVLDALKPGRRIFLFATGTGIAPFASLIRDPEIYEKFDQVILTHTTRTVTGLDYGKDVVRRTLEDPLVGEEAREKLLHDTATTREEYPTMGRITDRIRSGAFFAQHGLAPFNAAEDRAMICGSMGLNMDMKAILEEAGLEEGSNSRPGDYVVEKAFVGEGIGA